MTAHDHATPLSEKHEDTLPVLIEVLGGDALGLRKLFIGNRVAADNANLLSANGITSTMNLAVNIELLPLALPDGSVVRRTHIGLIDGPGNLPQHVLGAVFTLHGILGQASPGKTSYPPHRQGNVLVHCRGGRSRSAGVVALYLHLVHGEAFPSLDAALAHVRKARGLGPTHPLPDMVGLARRIVAHRETIAPLFGAL
ncbi:dual specificity protein phosphatase family protein [Oryzicola mucosus]|uniref:Dual specificity protein phosphatase family protein n=1 Tax=Oryzicola mucosus TaxID=2767425 RepID=A0A8J6PIA6_9HYPH|nr:dual specificity protein phosphatase [Oryzicola mucosus]MBD0415414.1 dual specificity protein phosphatase family protein [Oryzicola mucosus]